MPQPLMPKKLNLKGSVKTWRRKWQPTLVFLLGEPQGWGVWWSAVYGVTQSWTRLKWLSIKTYWRRQWHPTPVLLLGRSHGQRSLVGCSPLGHKELDMTKQLHFHFSLSCIGKRNGNPLQCSCLENPRDGGAWWAAIYGVTQSRTQLKWLSSSSRSMKTYKAF